MVLSRGSCAGTYGLPVDGTRSHGDADTHPDPAYCDADTDSNLHAHSDPHQHPHPYANTAAGVGPSSYRNPG